MLYGTPETFLIPPPPPGKLPLTCTMAFTSGAVMMFNLFFSISDSDQSPPRNPTNQMSKTLGGKKAGLQDAKAMKEEMLKLKKKERDNFDKVTNANLGCN